MKILKALFYTIGALIALLSALIMLSAFQPNLSKNLADLLYSRNGNTDSQISGNEISNNSVSDSTTLIENTVELSSNGIASNIPTEAQYILPNESDIITPQNVAGKNGYTPVVEDAKEIEAAIGETLAQTLGYGETGEGLDFDTRFYPYYGMLEPTTQSLYRQIYANALALNKSFAPIETVSVNQLRNVFMAVVGDHPELFWMDTAYGCRYLPSGKCAEIDLQFNSTATDLNQNKQLFESSADKIVQAAGNAGSDYEKEVAVHDTLISQIEYNLNAPLNQSAYSALVSGQTVCAGYARAYQYVMQKLGVPCYYCTGFAGENHAWNIISLDDGYYNVDTTWDDTDPNTYDYFNKSDNDFSTNHMRKDLSIYLPACNGENYKNLEATTSETLAPIVDNGRTLQDAGYSEENVLNTLTDYYTDSYNQIMANGFGTYQFQNVISKENVYPQLYDEYINNTYNDGYVKQVYADFGAYTVLDLIQIEELQGGYLLMTHNMVVQ